MRFESIRAHNIGPFSDVDIDLAAIEGKLVAVTGDNGAGKSTLLELLGAAIYRECPTRGPLAKLATARDAFVEVAVHNRAGYTLRQSVDSVSGKGESLVLDAAGGLALESAKVSEMDAWAARELMPAEVLYVSAFSPQSSAGFLELKPSERKRVLLRLLQIERLERMAKAAGEKSREAKATCETLRARIADAMARTPALDAAEAQLAQAQRKLVDAEVAADNARTALARATAASADAAKAAEIAAQRRTVAARIAASEARARDLAEKIGNNRKLLTREDEIREAVLAHGEALAASQRVESARLEAQTKLDGLHREAATARAAAAQASSRHAAAKARATRAEATIAEAPAIEAAAKRVEECARLETDLAIEQTRLEHDIDALRNLAADNSASRITGLRGGLAAVAAGPDNAAMIATGALDVDDAAVQVAAQAPAELAAQLATLAQIKRDRTGNADRHRAAHALAAKAQLISAATSEHAVAWADANEEQAASLELAAAADEHDAAAKLLAERVAFAVTELRDLALALHASAKLAELAPKLDQARARIEELEPQLVATETEIGAARAELAALPEVDATAVDLGAYEAAVRLATERVSAAHASVAEGGALVKAAHNGAATVAALDAELSEANVTLADWTRLSLDLGRDGLQALEIDAAIPELNEITNDLLHSCHGSRFTVELRTDRVSADGKRQLEDLDVRVIDTEHGRDASAETYSGGERVIVGEALSLALTTLACRRAGMDRPTLIRDESGAALDAANGRSYIAMLRRAAELIGADKVLFVSHTPELQGLADARIHVSGGTAKVGT